MSRPKAAPQTNISVMQKGECESRYLPRAEGERSQTRSVLPDLNNMYLQPPPPQQQHAAFSQPYQQNVPNSHTWANPNPPLSVEPAAVGAPVLSGHRQQQLHHGAGAFPQRLNPGSCEGNALPQLSMMDLQYLDTVSSGKGEQESQRLFHLQQQSADVQVQQHPGNLQPAWLHPGQHTFNGSGAARGGGSFPLLEGMEDNDFLKGLLGGGAPQFQLKQEPQIPAAPDTHTSVLQFPGDRQCNTYTDLLPRPMNSGSKDGLRQDAGGTQPLKNLHNPFSDNGVTAQVHYPTLADWIKASRHGDYKD